MSAKPSFACQSAAITEAVAIISRLGEMGEPEMAWLKQGAITLGKMSECEDLMRAVYLLHLETPALAMVLQALPGARIADVRETNGS